MIWLIWTVLVVALLVLVRRIRVSPKDFAAATNALLAEHHLSLRLSETSEYPKQLAELLRNVTRATGFPNATDELVFGSFDRRDRFVQLNLIALALDHAGIDPEIPGEKWYPFRNPFLLKRDDSNIQTVSERIYRQCGIRLEVNEAKLRFDNDRIVDG